MASIAVCSNSITALLTADASYESLPVLSCKLLEVRARAYKQSNIQMLKMFVESMKENFQMCFLYQ